MIKQPDWSKAPEGATHYLPKTPEHDWAACWYKQDGDGNWFSINADAYAEDGCRRWVLDLDELDLFPAYLIAKDQAYDKIKIKRLNPNAQLPTYGSAGAACFDLYAAPADGITEIASAVGSAIIETGLSFEVPTDHVMLVFSRSGHGFKDNTRLANCVGVIDSDYRGEVKVKLTRDDEGMIHVRGGDRIAQAMILPVKQVQFFEVDELSETERGAGGLGSTGS